MCITLALAAYIQAADAPVLPSAVTKLSELNKLVAERKRVVLPVQLEATVLWASAKNQGVALQDESGAAILELNLPDRRVAAGEKIRIKGPALIDEGNIRLGPNPLVDNDGYHSATERSASIHLAAGRHPLRLGIFNGTSFFVLKVQIEGPGLPRQNVPSNLLFHSELAPDGAPRFAPGLNFGNYPGVFAQVPDFRGLTPNKTGVTRNVTLDVRDRDEQVALQFTGWIEIPNARTRRLPGRAPSPRPGLESMDHRHDRQRDCKATARYVWTPAWMTTSPSPCVSTNSKPP